MSANLFLLDTETGGLDPSKHSLLSGYCAILSPHTFEIEDEFEFKHLEHVFRVQADALSVNKLDLSSFSKDGIQHHVICGRIEKMLDKAYRTTGLKPHPLGQNVQFDLSFIKTIVPHLETHINRRSLDTAVIALNEQMKGKLPPQLNLSLKSLGDHFGLNTTNCHDAKSDALLTLEVFKCLHKF